MFGSLGGAEILLILVLALLIFGPRKLPQIGRAIGRAMGEFRRATHDLRANLEQEVATEDLRETREALQEVGDDVSRAIQEASPRTLARGTIADDPPRPAAESVPDTADSDSSSTGVKPAEPTEPTDRDDGTQHQP